MILGSAQLYAPSRILNDFQTWGHFIAASKICKQFAPQLLNKDVKIFTNHHRTCKKHCVKLKAPKRMYYFLQRNRSLKQLTE
jgi:hypothetical protein